jgi:hypothetical protein
VKQSVAVVLYYEGMEDTPLPGEPDAFGAPRFDADFKPMYALSESQYQLIVNQMANLVFAAIEQFKHTRQGKRFRGKWKCSFSSSWKHAENEGFSMKMAINSLEDSMIATTPKYGWQKNNVRKARLVIDCGMG